MWEPGIPSARGGVLLGGKSLRHLRPVLEADHSHARPETENVEPLDSWVHVRAGYDEERPTGLIVVATDRRQPTPERMIVLGVGEEVRGVRPGDVVLVAPGPALGLRDGTKLVQRAQIVARLRD